MSINMKRCPTCPGCLGAGRCTLGSHNKGHRDRKKKSPELEPAVAVATASARLQCPFLWQTFQAREKDKVLHVDEVLTLSTPVGGVS